MSEPAAITAIRARAASSEGWPVLLPADRDRLTALAYIDVLQGKLAALESETESGEALVRARHYQGLCEELRGKVAELEAARVLTSEQTSCAVCLGAMAYEHVSAPLQAEHDRHLAVPVSPQPEETR